MLPALVIAGLVACSPQPDAPITDSDIRHGQQVQCDGGDWITCVTLGKSWEEGHRGPPDPAQAATLYRQACDHGDGAGCTSLGSLYARGLGVAVDVDKAKELYSKACDAQAWDGCAAMARLYLAADDVPNALVWLNRSCGNETFADCQDLAKLYRDGRGVPKDAYKAATGGWPKQNNYGLTGF